MSRYLLNKFLYTVDRDPELVERYREDPSGTVHGVQELVQQVLAHAAAPFGYQVKYASMVWNRS